ncbi:hypothetical protein [Candidatus Formimonas warabiya]|uniref:Uncharacterized protein n=1 Tax=Formimonas warabiya TaxID=1761012 RepID=A0A3G1KUI6_FORW1|nr:hypothetical protein [Candidatus Formimonas warabiya]ATW26106.1 hypothetical protein DCMF_16180 [Candidatus Formimonas warabiya]
MDTMQIRLGVAGTAKNTGKTTVTASMIQELRKRECRFFLTSIGYDGENIDNVTGLPKPKLRVEAGDIVVTAEKCLISSTAALEVMGKTDIFTPLGEVLITRVKKPGLVVTAGPNKSSEARRLNDLLQKLGPGITIFDGALNRIAPMTETDGFILATGAAKTPDILSLAQETEIIWRICNLPTVPRAAELAQGAPPVAALLSPDLKVIKRLDTPSLLSERDIIDLTDTPRKEGSYLYIPGIASEKSFHRACALFERQGGQAFFTFADPIKILAAGNPSSYHKLIVRLEKAGIFVGVLRRVPLLAVTVNPFYSHYRVESHTYDPAFVDAEQLRVSVQRAVQVPVYNIVKQGPEALVDLILSRKEGM